MHWSNHPRGPMQGKASRAMPMPHHSELEHIRPRDHDPPFQNTWPQPEAAAPGQTYYHHARALLGCGAARIAVLCEMPLLEQLSDQLALLRPGARPDPPDGPHQPLTPSRRPTGDSDMDIHRGHRHRAHGRNGNGADGPWAYRSEI